MQNDKLPLDRVLAAIDARAPAFTALADRIFDMPELRFEEVKSVAEQIAAMEAEGFAITRNVGGLPTAFMAESGDEGPCVAFLGEFDALAGLSQDPGALEPKTDTPGASGHGCGHNLLGSASALAAVGLRDALRAAGVKARVRYYGCPAEEGGSGKTYMVRAGAFADVDAAFTWHPCVFNFVQSAVTLGNIQAYFRFTGRPSHAAMSPQVGRSALDALELMNVGINFMREHMPDDARVHYSIIDAGGISPNVVQGSAEGLYLIRSPRSEDVQSLFARVKRIAEGAALMTDTSFEVFLDRVTAEMIPNRPLEEAMQRKFDEIGAPPFDAADFAFGDALQKAALTQADIDACAVAYGGPDDYPKSFHDAVLPIVERPGVLMGSTDVADVSWVVPTAQCLTATHAIGTPFHAWQTVTQGKLPSAHKAMITASKVMAATALEAVQDPDLLARARAELTKRLKGRDYFAETNMNQGLVPPTSSIRKH